MNSILIINPVTIIFYSYSILGLIMILFNNIISSFFYNLVLYFTDKLNLKELFLFKINRKNKDSLFSLMRSFIIMFGLMILSFCFYFLQYKLK